MSIYYVRKSGNDSNAGTSAGAAWLTISKALGASGISSGDTVYIGLGVYREKVICNLTSPVAETFVIGDVLGTYTSDAPGEIRITNYLTNDTTAPTDQPLLDLNGKDYLTFQHINFYGHWIGSDGTYPIDGFTIAGTSHITFTECVFSGQFVSASVAAYLYFKGTADTPAYWTIDKCYFFMPGLNAIVFNYVVTNTVDFDANIVVSNCVCVFANKFFIVLAGTGGTPRYQACGEIVKDCTLFVDSTAFYYQANTSTRVPSIPAKFYGNVVVVGGSGVESALIAEGTGQLLEDYNIISASNLYTNVSAGANSITNGSRALLFHTGQEFQLGQRARPVFSPTEGSPLLGFGTHSLATSVDILNRPRPAGGQSTLNAVGAYERHDTGVEDTSVYDSAPSSMKIIGPGDHDFEIPVNSLTAVNLTVMVRYNGDHGATNKPQVQVLADSLLGVNAETLTMTEAADTWEMLEFSSFTPLRYGIVKLRCISRAAAGNGIAYFDSITV